MKARIRQHIESGDNGDRKVNPASLQNLKQFSRVKRPSKQQVAEEFAKLQQTSDQPLTEALRYVVGRRHFDIAWALAARAIEGDVPAYREIADRLEGKINQNVTVTGQVNLAAIIAGGRARIAAAAKQLDNGNGKAEVVDSKVVASRKV